MAFRAYVGGWVLAVTMGCFVAACSDDLSLNSYTFVCSADSDCGSGWTCNEATNLCEQEAGPIADADIETDVPLDVPDTETITGPDVKECGDVGTPGWPVAETPLQVTNVGVDSLTIEWQAAQLATPECNQAIWYRICPATVSIEENCPVGWLETVPGSGLSTVLSDLSSAKRYVVTVQACVTNFLDMSICSDSEEVAATTWSDRTVRSVMAAVDHSCAVLADGSVWCWGKSDGNLLGNMAGSGSPPQPQRVLRTPPDGDQPYLDAVVKVVGGATYSCALRADGRVWCWGKLIDTDPPTLPTNAKLVEGVSNVMDLAASTGNPEVHICALTADGFVWCWGQNGKGQLALDPLTVPNQSGPYKLSKIQEADQISLGLVHSCALIHGNVWCWGSTEDGQTGVPNDSENNVTDVVPVGPATNVVSLEAGALHTCVIGDDDSLRCWGQQSYELFKGVNEDMASNYVPSTFDFSGVLDDLSGLSAMSAGFGFHCIRDGLGSLACWGHGGLGQCGVGHLGVEGVPHPLDRVSPAEIQWVDFPADTAVIQQAAGHSHSCATTHRGEAYCWGDNYLDKLGFETVNSDGTVKGAEPTPGLVSGLVSPMGARAIAVAGDSTCVLRADGLARCWGEGLGFANALSDDVAGTVLTVTSAWACLESPKAAPPGEPNCKLAIETGVEEDEIYKAFLEMDGDTIKRETVVANAKTFCGLKQDGTAFCQGSDDHGIVTSTPPTQRFVSLTMGSDHVCGLQANRHVFCWGNNDHDQLANTTGGEVSRLVLVEDLVPINEPIRARRIDAAANRTCAILVDGTAWCWGQGQTYCDALFPVGDELQFCPQELDGNFVSVALSDKEYCLLDAAGKVECYPGDPSNSDGDVFFLTTNANTFGSPAVALDAGANHVCVLLADGQVECLGANTEHQVGCDGDECETATPMIFTY